MALTTQQFMAALMDGLRACLRGYCLSCLHCGKIVPFLYGAPQQARPCKYCGRDMTWLGCIATPTDKQTDSNALPTSEAV